MRELVIRKKDDIELLKHVPRRFNSLRFELKFLSDEENKSWTEKLSKSYFSCGCKTGSYFAGVGILITILYALASLLFTFPLSIKWIAILVIGMTVIGKVIGLLYDYLQLRRQIEEFFMTYDRRRLKLYNTKFTNQRI